MPVRSRTAAISAGVIALTFGSASLPSIRSVVLASSSPLTDPTLCNPRMASMISLRIRALTWGFVVALGSFVITHLHQFAILDQHGELLGAHLEKSPREASEFVQFLGIDVAALILGEAVEKHRALAAPERDHRAVAAALSMSGARQALLDQTTAEIGVHEPRLDADYGLAKARVADPFLALKPRKTPQFEYPRQCVRC